MARVTTKRVYERKKPSDGTRILVMRLWPRGIGRSHVDGWLKELGAELPLIRAWKAGKISWPEFRRRYLATLKNPAAQVQLRELKALARKGTVTLLCACPDEARCHRGLLKHLLHAPRALRQSPGRDAGRLTRRRPHGPSSSGTGAR